MGNDIWIQDKGSIIQPNKIIIGQRIGIDYSGKDALLLNRFKVLHSYIKENGLSAS